MDGLEAVELKLSEVLDDNNNFRFDSEFFGRDAVFATNKIKSIKHSKLEDLVNDGYRVVYENTEIIDISKEDESNFCRFLQASDLQTPQILSDRIGYVSNADWERYPKGRIKTGELLIEVKGKCEKIAIVPAGFPEKTLVSGSLFKMTVNDNISREFLLIYLISKYGTALKDRLKTNLLISYINKPDLYNILVPIFSNDFQKHIETLVKLAHVKLEESKKLYSEAEELLLEELGLNDFTPSNEYVAIKSFSKSFGSSGRLDAEYYQLKYDDIIVRIKNYRGGYDLVKNQFLQNKTSYEKTQDSYDYIEISDVNVSNGEITPNSVLVEELPANAKNKVSKGDILVSKVRPYRGAVGIIEFEQEDLICSGAFTVLRENGQINKETLITLFRLSFYKELLLKYNVGTSYPVIKDEDVLNMPIPLIDENIQKIIAEKIFESFTLRAESKRLLEEAKIAVERAIESGEEESMKIIGDLS